jgi:hypothetical protein
MEAVKAAIVKGINKKQGVPRYNFKKTFKTRITSTRTKLTLRDASVENRNRFTRAATILNMSPLERQKFLFQGSTVKKEDGGSLSLHNTFLCLNVCSVDPLRDNGKYYAECVRLFDLYDTKEMLSMNTVNIPTGLLSRLTVDEQECIRSLESYTAEKNNYIRVIAVANTRDVVESDGEDTEADIDEPEEADDADANANDANADADANKEDA